MPARNGANGSESRKTTVRESGVSISRIVSYVDRCGERFRGLRIHAKVSRTSAEVSSLPSWNRTPSRSRKTTSVGDLASKPSARSGRGGGGGWGDGSQKEGGSEAVLHVRHRTTRGPRSDFSTGCVGNDRSGIPGTMGIAYSSSSDRNPRAGGPRCRGGQGRPEFCLFDPLS